MVTDQMQVNAAKVTTFHHDIFIQYDYCLKQVLPQVTPDFCDLKNTSETEWQWRMMGLRCLLMTGTCGQRKGMLS